MIEIPEYRGPSRKFLIRVDGRIIASLEREQLVDAYIQELYEGGVAVKRIEKYERVSITPEQIAEGRRTGKPLL